MERLNLRQLEIFSAVVDAGSFTAAAEKLYLAQSTVSDNVRALEELLHLKLFHRESKRRLTLTLEGKRVYRYAQDILGRCSALLLDVAVDSALELTLGASTVPAQSLLPGYMARFARENPACRCTLLCGDSAAVQQMLLNGDIHLGFVGSADDRQDLIYEPIAEDRLVLITPNTSRFAALKTQAVREVSRVHACTDVTGFGLLGHSYEMASGSGVTVRLHGAALPLLPQAEELADMGIVPGGAYRNRDYVKPHLRVLDGAQRARLDLAADPQTSGGLLVSLPRADAEELLEKLHAFAPWSAIVGEVLPQGESALEFD